MVARWARKLIVFLACGLVAFAMSACGAQPAPQPIQDDLDTLGQCQAAAQDLSSTPLPARALSPNLFPWIKPDRTEHIFDALAELKVRFIRVDFIWPIIEPSRGEHLWSTYDGFVKQARQHGIRILALVGFAPDWANGGGSSAKPPRDRSAWVSFLQALVGRYKPCGDLAAQEGWTDGYGIQAWEIWNEPNHPLFWDPAPDAAAYVPLLADAYGAIKTLDPHSVVLNGGLTMGTGGKCFAASCYIEKMYANGAKDYFDVMALHPYTPGPPDGIEAKVETVRALMDANGDAGKPIWLTEFGYVTDHVTEAEQADRLERAYKVTLPATAAYNVRALFWYSLVDATNSDENLFGLLRADFSRKQAYFRYRDALPGE